MKEKLIIEKNIDEIQNANENINDTTTILNPSPSKKAPYRLKMIKVQKLKIQQKELGHVANVAFKVMKFVHAKDNRRYAYCIKIYTLIVLVCYT